MRCPDCNKFVGLETDEPEVESINIDSTTVTAEVVIRRNCAECGTQLKEAQLSIECEVEIDESHESHDVSVEEAGIELIEEGGGRYKKSYYGARIDFKVTCSCGKLEITDNMYDKLPASSFDEVA